MALVGSSVSKKFKLAMRLPTQLVYNFSATSMPYVPKVSAFVTHVSESMCGTVVLIKNKKIISNIQRYKLGINWGKTAILSPLTLVL